MPGQPWLSVPGRCVSERVLNGNGPNMFSSEVTVAAARLASDTPDIIGAGVIGAGVDVLTGADFIPSGLIAEDGACAETTLSERGMSFSTPCVA